jgi:peptide/nickel transport system permease protein
MDDGSIVVFGAAEYGEKNIPEITAQEKMVSINAGTRHFVTVGESGKVYTWGHNDGGQCDVAGETADKVYTGAKQTYLVNEDNKLTDKSGFKGYPMGTDNRGRDILTRIVHGGKMTMTIGAVAVIVSTLIAIIVGCLAGYFGGWVDMLLMRITEIFSSLPFLPFAMMLSYVIRTMPIGETTRIFIIMVMLGLLSWTGLARMIRAQVLAEREKEFVLAAQSMGVKEKRIAFMHILPNVISVILVNVTLSFASCMLTESSLSYLGFGVQQPQPTWGNMLNGANNSIVIQNYWWQWVFPSIFLAIATISINIIGDTLRDVLDPKSSQEK